MQETWLLYHLLPGDHSHLAEFAASFQVFLPIPVQTVFHCV